MSYISGARFVADEQVRISSTKMDGIGPNAFTRTFENKDWTGKIKGGKEKKGNPMSFRCKTNFLNGFLIILFKILFVVIFCSFFYLLCMKLEKMEWFFASFFNLGFNLGGRALSFLLIKMGVPGCLSLYLWRICSLFFSYNALELIFFMDSGGPSALPKEVDLELRLAPPAQEVPPAETGQEQGEAPPPLSETQVRNRVLQRILSTNPLKAGDLDKIINLKKEILLRVNALEPSPFWTEQQGHLLSNSNSLLNKTTGAELTVSTLAAYTRLPNEEFERQSFFRSLLSTKRNFELRGRFD